MLTALKDYIAYKAGSRKDRMKFITDTQELENFIQEEIINANTTTNQITSDEAARIWLSLLEMIKCLQAEMDAMQADPYRNLPVGSMLVWFHLDERADIPAGFLRMDGGVIRSEDYPELFKACGWDSQRPLEISEAYSVFNCPTDEDDKVMKKMPVLIKAR